MSSDNAVIGSLVAEFQRLKRAADRGLEQLDEGDFHVRLNPAQNSIAVIIQHVHGNMLSRWRDFLTSDGEKSGRNREDEFVDRQLSRDQVLQLWEDGWQCVFSTLATLVDADLARTVTTRGEPTTAAGAIARQMGHYGWHIGQILLIAKHIRGEQWRYVTMPPVKK